MPQPCLVNVFFNLYSSKNLNAKVETLRANHSAGSRQTRFEIGLWVIFNIKVTNEHQCEFVAKLEAIKAKKVIIFSSLPVTSISEWRFIISPFRASGCMKMSPFARKTNRLGISCDSGGRHTSWQPLFHRGRRKITLIYNQRAEHPKRMAEQMSRRRHRMSRRSGKEGHKRWRRFRWISGAQKHKQPASSIPTKPSAVVIRAASMSVGLPSRQIRNFALAKVEVPLVSRRPPPCDIGKHH